MAENIKSPDWQGRLRIVGGDITHLRVDAIVNAANPDLLGGGGVDGAIHAAAGPELMNACRKIRAEHGRRSRGDAVITGAGRLNCHHVIHAVGPVWRGGLNGEDEALARTYRSALNLASMLHLKSVALPNISTGIYGFPKARACHIAITIVKEFLDQNPFPETVIFCCHDEENESLYKRAITT